MHRSQLLRSKVRLLGLNEPLKMAICVLCKDCDECLIEHALQKFLQAYCAAAAVLARFIYGI